MSDMLSRGRGLLRRIARGILVVVSPSRYFLYRRSCFDHHNLSFSLEGEDLMLGCMFRDKKTGFYVDIGAHHPQHFSTTYAFYLRGWSGINIDALPGSMKEFDRVRPRDRNLEIAVSGRKGVMKFTQFREPSLSGFFAGDDAARNGADSSAVTATFEMETTPLARIMETYMPAAQQIDVMSIDVEGMELEVLQSNDWERYRPTVVLVEVLNLSSVDDVLRSDVYLYLKLIGYELIAKTINNLVFRTAALVRGSGDADAT